MVGLWHVPWRLTESDSPLSYANDTISWSSDEADSVTYAYNYGYSAVCCLVTTALGFCLRTARENVVPQPGMCYFDLSRNSNGGYIRLPRVMITAVEGGMVSYTTLPFYWNVNRDDFLK